MSMGCLRRANLDRVRDVGVRPLKRSRGLRRHRTAVYRTIFPQMTNCLPEDEGAQLRFDFETELARLKAA